MTADIWIAYGDGVPPHIMEHRALADTLRERGFKAEIFHWRNDSAPPPRAVVLRHTWDYFDHPNDFIRWLGGLADGGSILMNSLEMVRGNMHKTYLLDFAERGLPVPKTILAPQTQEGVLSAMEAMGLTRAVMKPVVSAGAIGLRTVDRMEPGSLPHEDILASTPYLLQELLPEIAEGEVSLVYIAGTFSHAVLKMPAKGEIRVQEEFGGHYERFDPPTEILSDAERILAAIPETPVYARIDGVIRQGRFLLMEIELIEPELFFGLCPEACGRLADAVIQRLDESAL